MKKHASWPKVPAPVVTTLTGLQRSQRVRFGALPGLQHSSGIGLGLGVKAYRV